MKAVVVGASSGLGRCIARGIAERGGSVALLARRYDRLVDAAAECGPDAVAIACDVTDADSCQSAIEQAAKALDGIDALVYATGIGDVHRLEEMSVDEWRRLFDTNVIGASLVTAAALPHLKGSAGVAAYLSTISASQTPPWPGLGGYAVSKAALDKLIEAWRGEHPGVGFTRVVVGDCAGGEGGGATGFNQGWDLEVAAEFAPIWHARQYIAGALLDVEDLVQVVHTILACGASAVVPSVTVAPRPAH